VALTTAGYVQLGTTANKQAISLASGGINVGGSGYVHFVAPIGGTTVTKTGANECRVFGANTFSKLVVSEGLFRIGNTGVETGLGAVPGSLTDDAVTLNGSTAKLGSSTTLVDMDANRGLTIGSSGGTIWSGDWNIKRLCGSGPFTVDTDNLAIITLAGGAIANTYSGAMTINMGTVLLSKNAGVNAIAGGTITVGNSAGTDQLTLAANNQIADTVVLTINGATSGNSGKFNLAGYDETVAGISSADAFSVIQNTEAPASTVGTSTLTVNNSSAYSFAGIIRDHASGSASPLALTKSGVGTLTLSGTANTFSGAVNVSGGVLSINAQTAIGDSANLITISSGATLRNTGGNGDFIPANRPLAIGSGGGTIEVSASAGTVQWTDNLISGTGNTLTKAGVGEFRTLDQHNTFGKLIVSGGMYTLGSGGYVGYPDSVGTGTGADAITLAGGTSLRLAGEADVAFTSSQGITLSGAATIRAVAGRVLTIPGVITGGYGLTIGTTDTGTVVLSGDNNYSGATTVSTGTLSIGAGGTSGSVASASIVDNAALIFNRSDDLTYPGVISGGGSATKQGAGTLYLTGANTFTGGLTISGGTVSVGDGGTTGELTVSLGTMSTVNNGALIFNKNANFVTYAGVISGSGTLTKLGTGVLKLNAANTYSGNTTIGGGTLQCNEGTGSTLPYGSGKGEVIVNAPGTLALHGYGLHINGLSGDGTVDISNGSAQELSVGNDNDTTTFGGAIKNTVATLSLTKVGTGTLTLSGANTYSGATTVTAGGLLVNGSTGSGTVTVQNTATLGGNGTIGGAASVASGGTLAPGAALGSIGTLTLGAVPSLGGTVAMQINKAAGPVYTADKVNLTSGVLNYGGTLTVTELSGSQTLSGGEVFDLFDSSDGFNTGSSFGTLNLPTLPTQEPALNWFTDNLTGDGTIIVNRAPIGVADHTLTRAKGVSMKIKMADLIDDLMNGVSELDSGDSASFDGFVSMTSNQGVTVTNNGIYYFYYPINDNADFLQYKVKDNRGGLVTKKLNIKVEPYYGSVNIRHDGGGEVTLSFWGIPGYSYYVQRSCGDLFNFSDLEHDNPVICSDSGLVTFKDTPPVSGCNSAFYRLRSPAGAP